MPEVCELGDTSQAPASGTRIPPASPVRGGGDTPWQRLHRAPESQRRAPCSRHSQGTAGRPVPRQGTRTAPQGTAPWQQDSTCPHGSLPALGHVPGQSPGFSTSTSHEEVPTCRNPLPPLAGVPTVPPCILGGQPGSSDVGTGSGPNPGQPVLGPSQPKAAVAWSEAVCTAVRSAAE